jgi:transposase
MAQRRRPTYSPEFRAEAVRLVRTSSEPVSRIAKEVGVNPRTLHQWVEATRPKADAPLTDDERTELKRLPREVRILREEREILKKASAFVAKHQDD